MNITIVFMTVTNIIDKPSLTAIVTELHGLVCYHYTTRCSHQRYKLSHGYFSVRLSLTPVSTLLLTSLLIDYETVK